MDIGMDIGAVGFNRGSAESLDAGSELRFAPAAAVAEESVLVVAESCRVQRSVASLMQAEGLDVQAFNSAEFLRGLGEVAFGCVILDLQSAEALRALCDLKRSGVAMPVVCLGKAGDATLAVEAFRAGAFDVVGRDGDEDLINCVHSALQVEARRRRRVAVRADRRARLNALTRREMEIAGMIADGMANKVVAYELGISERTVECHRAKIMKKIGSKSVVDLVRTVLLAADPEVV